MKNVMKIRMATDNMSYPMQLLPPAIPKASYKNDAVTTSSAVYITLNENTALVRIIALDNGLWARFQASASSTDFHMYIPGGMVLDYPLPDDVSVISLIGDEGTSRVRVFEY